MPQSILAGLRASDDEGSQLGALAELNELLSIGSEDSLAGFPVEATVPLLVQALHAEHSPDTMLMAARALTHLADVLPQACPSIVRHGAPAALCARLLTIEYIDLVRLGRCPSPAVSPGDDCLRILHTTRCKGCEGWAGGGGRREPCGPVGVN